MFLILLLLAVWGGVGVWWFMSRPEGRSTDSIGSFRQQLRVLERTGPTTVAAAYRMESPDLGVYGAQRVPSMSTVANRSLPLNPTIIAARRRRAQKRRRDVFYSLLAAVAGSVLLGFLPGLSIMWWLAAMLIAALAFYIVVLVQLKAAGATPKPVAGANVRYLHAAQLRQGQPAYLLRSSATN
ncbi:MAG: hypothetical protein ACYDH6_23715 [Acidimicrobiales bacterium]